MWKGARDGQVRHGSWACVYALRPTLCKHMRKADIGAVFEAGFIELERIFGFVAFGTIVFMNGCSCLLCMPYGAPVIVTREQ